MEQQLGIGNRRVYCGMVLLASIAVQSVCLQKPLNAQVSDGGESAFADSTVERLTREFPSGAKAKVWTQWGPLVVATAGSAPSGMRFDTVLSGQSLLPDSIRLPGQVPVDLIDAIQKPVYNPLKPALRAGIAGAVLGALVGVMDNSGDDVMSQNPGNRQTGLTPTTGALIFGGVGVVIGGVTGFLRPEWRNVYERPQHISSATRHETEVHFRPRVGPTVLTLRCGAAISLRF